MNNKLKKEFIDQCKKNRNYLGYSFNDVADCLIGVSEEDYMNFEENKYTMSKDNIKRLIRVLCINKPEEIKASDYIDISGLDENEVKDLSDIVEFIVGENND